MKRDSSDSFRFRPFRELKKILKKSKAQERAKTRRAPTAPTHTRTIIEQDEKKDLLLFNKAMADVTPLPAKKPRLPKVKRPPHGGHRNTEEDRKVREKMNGLITHGYGFEVSNTPEYTEGTGYTSHPEMSRRLHRGDFAIQAHLDLHGMNIEEAWQSFDSFLKESLKTARQAVLIIHGRGLSSPGEPVLKNKVGEWLACGPWRKWVAAFASARPEDGGTGATYVLLRARPVRKSARKGKKIRHY